MSRLPHSPSVPLCVPGREQERGEPPRGIRPAPLPGRNRAVRSLDRARAERHRSCASRFAYRSPPIFSEAFLTVDRRPSSFSERMCQGPPPVPTRCISPQWNVRGSRMRYASLSVFRPFIAESLRERDQLMRHIVLTIAMLAAAPAAVAQNYPPSQTYSPPPASDTDNGASGPAMRGQSQSGSSHSGVPTAQNSQENCGTPDEFKACPPLPRHPLPYYPANRHD